MKIRHVGVELFHAGGRTDRRTDMTKLIVVFRIFADAPKQKFLHVSANLKPTEWRSMFFRKQKIVQLLFHSVEPMNMFTSVQLAD
jgi:hypothetical protein